MVCLGFQLETALGHVAAWLIVEGSGEPFTFLTKCGGCCFPAALWPSPQLLFLPPHCQRGDSLPRFGEMSKLGRVWFPGPGPASSLLWLTICGLLLSVRALHQQAKVRVLSIRPLYLDLCSVPGPGPMWPGLDKDVQTGPGNWVPVRVWTSSCLQSELAYLPDAAEGVELRCPYMKAGTYTGGKPLETNQVPDRQA